MPIPFIPNNSLIPAFGNDGVAWTLYSCNNQRASHICNYSQHWQSTYPGFFLIFFFGGCQRLIGKVAIGSPQHTDAPCHLFWICMQLATHVISVYSLRCSDVADHQGIHLAISTATLKVSSAYFCLHEVFLAFAQSLRCSDVAGHLKPHCQGRHITRYLCRFVDSLGVWAIVWQEKMSKLALFCKHLGRQDRHAQITQQCISLKPGLPLERRKISGGGEILTTCWFKPSSYCIASPHIYYRYQHQTKSGTNLETPFQLLRKKTVRYQKQGLVTPMPPLTLTMQSRVVS